VSGGCRTGRQDRPGAPSSGLLRGSVGGLGLQQRGFRLGLLVVFGVAVLRPVWKHAAAQLELDVVLLTLQSCPFAEDSRGDGAAR